MKSFVGLAIATLLISSCGLLSRAAPGSSVEMGVPYPDGCPHFELSARRCKAILDWAVTQSKSAPRPVTSVEMLGDPQCGPDIDGNILCMRSTTFVVRMRLHFEDGGSVDESVFCGVGGQYSILCTETPEIALNGPTFGGYWDTSGATPPPIPPKDQLGARPLHVAALDVPVDHVGHYEVEMGRAVVPLGILTHANVALGNPQTQAVTLGEGGLNFVIRSTTPGAKPFDNLYVRGWHAGTEEVRALLVFDVIGFEAGAVLQMRDLVVE